MKSSFGVSSRNVAENSQARSLPIALFTFGGPDYYRAQTPLGVIIGGRHPLVAQESEQVLLFRAHQTLSERFGWLK